MPGTGIDIDLVSNLVYTSDNITRAAQYLRRRGLDPDKINPPWTFTDKRERLYAPLREWLPPFMFTESLFIPIPNVENPRVCEGFDVRYLGEDPRRSRFHKLKRSVESITIYGWHHAVSTDGPVLCTEGAIDAESINQLGLKVKAVSPLTRMRGLKWIYTLRLLSTNILVMYDNDTDGQKATRSLVKELEGVPDSNGRIRAVSYRCKDPNEALTTLGKEMFKTLLKPQLSGLGEIDKSQEALANPHE